MRRRAGCLLRPATVALGLLLLSGCPAPPRHEAPAPGAAPPPASAAGTPYVIDPAASLLTIRVYRAGALAAAGHNHVIASHDLSGTIRVAPETGASGFEVHVPLAALTVDERELRVAAGADFPPDVPDSAREGTRHNMLGAALLDEVDYPGLVLSSVRLADAGEGAVAARVQALVRGTAHEFEVTVHVERSAAQLVASGATPLKQSELGLKPFSALLGALQVQDEMQVAFRIVARPSAAPPRG